MAKNLKNLKSVEFIDTAAKRALVNGMTVTYVEKFTGMKKKAVAEINGRLKVEDYKNLQGKTMADCICQESQHIIAESLKSGNSQKWVMLQSKLPKSVISAIADKYGITDTDENEAIEANNESITEDNSIEVDVTEDGVTARKRRGRAPKYDDDVAELMFTENRNGKTYDDLAVEYGIPRSSVLNLIRRWKNINNINAGVANRSHNTPAYRGSIPKETVLSIANDIIAGERNVDIAMKYSINPYTVSEIRRKRLYASITEKYDFTYRDYNHELFERSDINRETFNKIIEMLMNQKSNKDISIKLGVPENIIRDIRVKRTFRNLTRDMEFPEPIPFRYETHPHNYQRHDEMEETDIVSNEIPEDQVVEKEVKEDIMENNDEFVDVNASTVIAENTNEIEDSVDTDNERENRMYFGKIAKTFAADRAAVIIVKDNQMISYMVANTIEECMIRTISLLSPEEIHESNAYISGRYNDMHSVMRMSKIIEINEVIIK